MAARTPSPIHEETATARPSQPGQEPKAPAQAKRPVATSCQTMCQTRHLPRVPTGEEAGDEQRGRPGRAEGVQDQSRTREDSSARYAHAHAMALSYEAPYEARRRPVPAPADGAADDERSWSRRRCLSSRPPP